MHVLGCSWHSGPPWRCDGFGCDPDPSGEPVEVVDTGALGWVPDYLPWPESKLKAEG